MARRKKKNASKGITLLSLVIVCGVLLLNYYYFEPRGYTFDLESFTFKSHISYSLDSVPEYNGEDYVIINNNVPDVVDLAKTTESFEVYSELDKLGRCGVAYSNISKELMPTEPRESIGSVKPSGWKTTKYDNVDGKYLYNRCHLIGFQLTGENANNKNLITCTRYANAVTMLKFENEVTSYIKKTNNHVLYRVTPVYKGNDLVASGIQMEALSIEDNGKGIKFNVYIYNIQPGIEINYFDGSSKLIE